MFEKVKDRLNTENAKVEAEMKKKGIPVTCDVAAHHLVLTDEDLADFDSNYKVKPPLRTITDVKALIKGLKDGVIDPVKVVRCALTNAASVSSLMLTTETMIAEAPKKDSGNPGGGHGGMGGMGGMDGMM